jgi:arginase
VIHVGGRDFDPEEGMLLEHSEVQIVSAESIRQTSTQRALESALDGLRTRVEKIHLHIDLNVLNPEETPANEYSLKVPNGLRVKQIEEAIQMIGGSFRICASGIVSYDPSYDRNGQTLLA